MKLGGIIKKGRQRKHFSKEKFMETNEMSNNTRFVPGLTKRRRYPSSVNITQYLVPKSVLPTVHEIATDHASFTAMACALMCSRPHKHRLLKGLSKGRTAGCNCSPTTLA